MTLTLKQFAALGGRASWKGVSKKKRSEMMKKLAHRRWNKGRQQARTVAE